jgi:transposase
MEAVMSPFDLTDTEWSVIAPLLPGAEGKRMREPVASDDGLCLIFASFTLRGLTSCLGTDAEVREFAAIAGILDAAERQVGRCPRRLVDEDQAGVDLPRDPLSLLLFPSRLESK